MLNSEVMKKAMSLLGPEGECWSDAAGREAPTKLCAAQAIDAACRNGEDAALWTLNRTNFYYKQYVHLINHLKIAITRQYSHLMTTLNIAITPAVPVINMWNDASDWPTVKTAFQIAITALEEEEEKPECAE